MSPTRKLAAILFTDIAGFSAVMQRDETAAVAMAQKHENSLRLLTEKFEGKICNFYGDGSLSIFDSSVNALRCAMKLQETMFDKPAVPLRIGLHVGEVLFEKGQVYGDGVNIASRIESIGTAGAILFSKNILQNVQNLPEFEISEAGPVSLKNIQTPIEIFYISNPGFAHPKIAVTSGNGKTKVAVNTIAVLPFKNVSSDPEQEYFCDGVSDEIIRAISQIEGLRVTSRTSSFSVKNKSHDVETIGRLLKVQLILEGSVRKAGNQIRLICQLVKTEDGYQLWSDRFDRKLEDIFQIQDDIARQIAKSLMIELNLGSHQRIVRKETANMQAYELYLQGKFHYNKRTKEDNLKAVSLLEKAIGLDSDFALAHGAIAMAYVEQFFTYDPSEKWEEKALIAAEAAVSLDPDIPEIYVAKGNLLWTRSHGFPHIQAIKEYRKALGINPFHADAHNELARVYWHVGRMDLAIEAFNTALETNPELSTSIFRKGWFEIHRGNFREALALLESVPEGSLRESMKISKAMCLIYLRDEKGARSLLIKLKEELPEDPEVASVLSILLALEGKHVESKSQIKLALDKGSSLGHFHHITHHVAQSFAIMDQEDDALKWLKFTSEDGFPCLPWFQADPLLENVRGSVGFQQFIDNLQVRWHDFEKLG